MNIQVSICVHIFANFALLCSIQADSKLSRPHHKRHSKRRPCNNCGHQPTDTEYATEMSDPEIARAFRINEQARKTLQKIDSGTEMAHDKTFETVPIERNFMSMASIDSVPDSVP